MSPPNLPDPPGYKLVPPTDAEWQDILAAGGEGIMRDPYSHDHRMELARALYHRGFPYEARILMSGKLVPLMGRHYFPAKVPSCSVHDADAARHGLSVIPVEPAANRSDWITGSIGLDPTPACMRARPRWKREHFVARISGGSAVASANGYAVFSRDGHYVTDFCCNDGPMIPFSGAVPPATRLTGTVALFLHFCSFAVFHWMMESLPRFELLRLAEQLDRVDHFAMRKIHPWHWEFIDLLGLPREKFITLGDVCNIEADELLVCSNVEDCDFSIFPAYFEPEPWVTDLVARLAPPSPQVAATERIYVSREKAGGRQTSNAGELEIVLKRYGFKTVFFEDMSFAEKSACLKSAEYLISPWGAGLTNVPLMQPGSKCIVLYCEDTIYSGHNVIAANAGVTHIHHISPALSRSQPEAMRQMPEHMRQITVDLVSLEQLFASIGLLPRQF
jgi:capsular polysaccharide biosynthesis protein